MVSKASVFFPVFSMFISSQFTNITLWDFVFLFIPFHQFMERKIDCDEQGNKTTFISLFSEAENITVAAAALVTLCVQSVSRNKRPNQLPMSSTVIKIATTYT